jgi:hypothetical protein
MRTRDPTALELVDENCNAIGFGPTERASEPIFSIAVFPAIFPCWISLFFLPAQKAEPKKPS